MTLKMPAQKQINISIICIFPKWNSFRRKGTKITRDKKKAAPPNTHAKALLKTDNVDKMLLVQERFVKIRHKLETISVTNVNVLALFSPCPVIKAILKTAMTIISAESPCNKLKNSIFFPKSDHWDCGAYVS